MLCPRCGVAVQSDFLYCPSCGESLRKSFRGNYWRKWLFAFVIVFLLVVLWNVFSGQNLSEVVEGQLVALRDNKITEAYYEFASRELQGEMPLAAFRELVKSYPALSKNQRVQFQDQQISNDVAMLKGVLISKEQETPVEYNLVKEDSAWKIRNMVIGIPGVIQNTTSIEWLRPIDAQLRALRQKDIKQAYEEPTSKDFKASTTFEDFNKFVQHYPILTNHSEIAVSAQSIGKNEADVTITLDPEGDAVPVQFRLMLEDGKWKIWNLSMSSPYSETVMALLEDPKTMRKPIEGLLQELRRDEVTKGYYDYTSHDFQKTTPLDSFRKFLNNFQVLQHYDAVEFKEPILSKTTGLMEVNFYDRVGKTTMQFTLGIEDGKWKIWGMQVVSQMPQSVSPREKEPSVNPAELPPSSVESIPTTQPSAPPPSEGGLEGNVQEGLTTSTMVFAKAEVGTGLNLRGEVVDPATTIHAPHGDIYVNLYISNGVARARIDINLVHVESHSTLPTVSTTLQQDGDSRLSFAFSPPPQGWPKGHYKMRVSSSIQAQREFIFVID